MTKILQVIAVLHKFIEFLMVLDDVIIAIIF